MGTSLILFMVLEDLLKDVHGKWKEISVQLAGNSKYQYAVDVLSGWTYYTPVYAAQELLAGKDIETVVKTRLIGMAAHTVAMRPIGLLRNHFAQKWNVTSESSFVDKLKVNVVAVIPVQAVVYAGMLFGGMAWSGQYDWKASAYAWGMGVALGAVHSFPYGSVQDKVRTFFGIKPAIAATELVHEKCARSATGDDSL